MTEREQRLARSRDYNEGIRQRAEAEQLRQRADAIGQLSRKVSELETRIDRLKD